MRKLDWNFVDNLVMVYNVTVISAVTVGCFLY